MIHLGYHYEAWAKMRCDYLARNYIPEKYALYSAFLQAIVL